MLNPSRFVGLVGLFAPLAVALSACVSIIGLPEVPNLAEGDSPESGPPRTDSAVDPSRDGSADTALDTGLDVDIASPDGEGGTDGGQTKPPSCKERTAPGIHDCGPFTSPATRGTEDCCASPLVNSDRTSFNRLFISSPGSASAKVSPFRLDKYEVTVGRFRAFVAAAAMGFSPAPGSGKHTHLRDLGGSVVGLALPGGGFEQGWQDAFDPNMTAFLAVNDTKSTYRASPPDDRRPVNLVTWAEAYAFCIWDGGFLPTEAEWIYAAANGSAQRQWPYGNSPSAVGNAALAIIGHNYPVGNTKAISNTVNQIAPVGFPMNGDSAFGQSDLTGNLQEYVLDRGDGNSSNFPNAPQTDECTDCTTFSGGQVIVRGGNYGDPPSAPITGNTVRGQFLQARADFQGFRCARSPL